MANLLKMAISETIRTLHRRGWSQRRIAAELRINRETVARHLRQADAPPKPANAPRLARGPQRAKASQSAPRIGGWSVGFKTSQSAPRLRRRRKGGRLSQSGQAPGDWREIEPPDRKKPSPTEKESRLPSDTLNRRLSQ